MAKSGAPAPPSLFLYSLGVFSLFPRIVAEKSVLKTTYFAKLPSQKNKKEYFAAYRQILAEKWKMQQQKKHIGHRNRYFPPGYFYIFKFKLTPIVDIYFIFYTDDNESWKLTWKAKRRFIN